jgi:hypothetical protein
MYKLASMSQQDDWTVKKKTTAKTAPTRDPKALRAHLLSTRIGETLTNNPANALSLLLILSVSAEIMLHIRGGQKALNFPKQKMMSQQQQKLH